MAVQGEGLLNNPAVQVLAIVISTYLFLKFCGWAKTFTIPGGFKTTIYVVTGLGLIIFNVLYSKGNQAVAFGDYNPANMALAVSMIFTLIFAFALMAEKKTN